MQCHYCGYKTNLITKCKECGSNDKIYDVGGGVEKVEEEVRTSFPNARTLILSSDTIDSRKKMLDAISDIIEHKYDIIIGTQMITKGLHFPSLQLVAILDIDNSIIAGDIRVLEKTYQLIHQVSGRAGRVKDRGKVVVQTYNTDNIFISQLTSQNKEEFNLSELQNRESAHMPPFSRLAIITLSSSRNESAMICAHQLARDIPIHDKFRVLGPSASPIFLLRGKYRYRFLIIAEKNCNIQNYIRNWLSAIKVPYNVKLKIDVDPINFL